MDPKDIRVDVYGTSAPSGQREGTLRLTHLPTNKVVQKDWSEPNHDSLLRVKETAMVELMKLVEEDNNDDDA